MIYILLICGVVFFWVKYNHSKMNTASRTRERSDCVDLDTEYYDLSSKRVYRVKAPTKPAASDRSKYHAYSEYTSSEKSREVILHSSYGISRYKTGALDDDKVLDVIERYREPVKKPQSDNYPARYETKDYKPVQPEEKKTVIIDKSPAPEPSSIVEYKPNEIIATVIKETREKYQLPPGAVEMPREETAAIVATILYFINEEPKIGITKLEYYIILLDKMCLDETGKRLFSYRLTYGPFGYYIQNFRAFLDFIEDKKILSKRRKYYTRRKYRIDFTAHHEVPEELFPDNMLGWMERILFTWRDAGAEHTKRGILQQFSMKEIHAFTELE